MGESSSQHEATLLVTAFEPSGDAHAAAVVACLQKLAPEVRIYACGGPLLEKTGVTMIEQTADNAAMGLHAFGKAAAVRRTVSRLKRWAKEYRVVGHVAVDSPAANFPICKLTRAHGARVIHLVAPQLWAWGGWRVKKLKRLTDLVLCLLPFEEEWFKQRGIPAKFIGHPSINRELDEAALHEAVHGLPQGTPRIGIFPGSRPHEVTRNIRLLVDIYTELQGRHAGVGGLIVASSNDIAKLVRKKIRVFPNGLHMAVGNRDVAIHWCELALTVSGTVTLDIARQQRPMIGVYHTGLLAWMLSKIVLRTPLRLLPNIIAGREIVPEYVPHVGGSTSIVKEATRLLGDSRNSAIQAEELGRIRMRYRGHDYAREAAESIVEVLRKGR